MRTICPMSQHPHAADPLASQLRSSAPASKGAAGDPPTRRPTSFGRAPRPRSLQKLLLLVCALARDSAVDLCSFTGTERNGNPVASGSLCDGSYTGTSLCA